METGNVTERLRKLVSEIYAFNAKIYDDLGKNGTDARIAELLNEAESRDDRFLARELTLMRNTMDQWFYVIRYLNEPVRYEGRLKPISHGRWTLNGVELKDGTQLEYVDAQDEWQFGLFKRDPLSGDYQLLNIDAMPIKLPLDDLRVRTRQDIGKGL